MKRLFFIIGVVASSFAITNAQNTATSEKPAASKGETPQSIAKRMVGKINSVCHLHDDQFVKVNKVYTDFYEKSEALAKQKLGKAKFNTQEGTLKTDRDTALQASLDPGQWQKWVNYQRERGK